MTHSTPTDLAHTAALLYRQRSGKAAQAVAQGASTPAQATAALRPWLAIACLAGADLPELEAPLADLRQVQLFPGKGVKPRDATRTDAEARSILAGTICPPTVWARALAEARNRALELPVDAPAAAIDHARAVQALCSALQVTLPYQPRAIRKDAA